MAMTSRTDGATSWSMLSQPRDQRVERRGKQPLEKTQNYFERPAKEQYGAEFLELNLFPLTRAAVVSPWSHGNKIVQTNDFRVR